MNTLLSRVIDAHGGLKAWDRWERVEASVVSGGGFFPLKGFLQDPSSRRLTAWLHRERASIAPFGNPEWRMTFTPERVVVETLGGALVNERKDPDASFVGHQMNTKWDPLHYAYFSGEALWTYFTTPFLLTLPGVEVEEVEPWKDGAESWRVLRAYFPGTVATHSRVQDFFFDEELLLRRHDYSVDVAGAFPAAQLVSDYVEAEGIRLPTKRRAYTRGPDRRPVRDMLMVFIDILDVAFRPSASGGAQ